MMHLEVEQKFRVASLAAIREQAAALGCQFDRSVDQADTYFSHPARNFAQTDEALRLRRVGEQNCITYKGPKIDRETKTRRELELPLPPGKEAFEQHAELLAALGFAKVATVEKRRQPGRLRWQAHEVEVALDDVANVGPFVEVEIGTDEAGLSSAKAALLSLAAALGLAESERRSYLELLLATAAK
jgi:adenylate cyclase class 2